MFIASLANARDIVLIEKSNPKPISEREAILILPGLGTFNHNTKSQKENFRDKGYDIFIPDYISRKSVSDCSKNVLEFYDKHELKKYKHVHVFSYIIGSWTINEILLSGNKPQNIVSIIYDRSPMQEMAPRILVDENKFFSKILFGKLIFELANTPYKSIENDELNIGILIECKATKLMNKKKKSLVNYDPISWKMESLNQNPDDFEFLYVSHDDMYTKLEIIAPSVFQFVKNGKFSEGSLRSHCEKEPFEDYLSK